jgi:tRNA nucleotidyltransferase/poly(A) polymerase
MIALPGPLLEVARALGTLLAESAGGPAWIVGGAVRDALLGRPVRDLDVVLPAGSLVAARRLADRLGAAFVPLGEPHGLARVVVPGSPPAVLDLADLRGPTLAADLAARDVTVDALAAPLDEALAGTARVRDPLGGLDDLRARRLRACRPSAFADDPVRVVRVVRLAHELGFAVEPATAGLARAAAGGLARAPGERLRDEVTRLLALPRAAASVRELDAWGALAVLVPEIEAMRATAQSAPHRFTVLEHSIRAVEAVDQLLADLDLLGPHAEATAAYLDEPVGSGLRRREVLKIAALLHDVAKPETRTVDPDGRTRFTGHDRLGADRAGVVVARLRWPRRAADLLARLVRHHLRPMHLGLVWRTTGTLSRRARYRFGRDVGTDVPGLVCLTIADAAATDGQTPAAVYRGGTRALLETLLGAGVESTRQAETPPLVRGEDVMAAFGLAPGPEVGRLLRRAREAQALGTVRTREEALALLAVGRPAAPPRGPGSAEPDRRAEPASGGESP